MRPSTRAALPNLRGVFAIFGLADCEGRGFARRMDFTPPLTEAVFLRRYKRFFADFELEGQVVTSACANTGRMTGLLTPGARALIQPAANPKRKLAWDWVAVEADGTWVGCHTAVPNTLGFEAVRAEAIPELRGYARIEKERKYGQENSRIDLLLTDPARPPCYVEIKNVHLVQEPGVASFPDAVTARGLKHLRELRAEVAAGHRAVMLYIVQRGDCQAFSPADAVDPAYGAGLRAAAQAGVEILVYSCHVSADQITLASRLDPIL